VPDPESILERVENGHELDRDEALRLASADCGRLSGTANRLRMQYDQNKFELCSIVNAKSGLCSEDCKFCAQSNRHGAGVETYGLIDPRRMAGLARTCAEKGVKRFSIVTSGRRLDPHEMQTICDAANRIQQETDLELCASIGLAREGDYKAMRDAGITRIHNNLETSRRYFGKICTTHAYDDKLRAIEKAQACGFEICSGGIIGMGETVEDRIDLAFEVRKIGAVSMPVNILVPIQGTPLEDMEVLQENEILKCVSLMKIINPKITVRMAGGRKLLGDKGRACFLAGSNAAITGDMLTTSGVAIDEDIRMLRGLAYEV